MDGQDKLGHDEKESLIMKPWDHPLIQKGMPLQLEKRRARIAAGERPVGWKVGLGAPASMQKVGITAPIVGFLMQRALLLSGSTVSLEGYVKPVAEAEICVRMMSDLRGGATPDAALAAVKEIFPAIEIADLDPAPTPDNLDVVLEGDIYQRHVILCGNTRFGGSTAGLTSRIIRKGAPFASTTDPETLTGKLPEIVAPASLPPARPPAAHHSRSSAMSPTRSRPSAKNCRPATSSSPARSRRRSCWSPTTPSSPTRSIRSGK